MWLDSLSFTDHGASKQPFNTAACDARERSISHYFDTPQKGGQPPNGIFHFTVRTGEFDKLRGDKQGGHGAGHTR